MWGGMLGLLTAGALAATVLGGCATSADGGGGDLAGTAWQLESIRGVPAPAEAWIAFETASRAGGRTGCNLFGASYDRIGSTVRFGMAGMTEMACAEPAMQQEAAFVMVLRDTRRIAVSGSSLTMMDEAGQVTARFTRRDS